MIRYRSDLAFYTKETMLMVYTINETENGHLSSIS